MNQESVIMDSTFTFFEKKEKESKLAFNFPFLLESKSATLSCHR